MSKWIWIPGTIVVAMVLIEIGYNSALKEVTSACDDVGGFELHSIEYECRRPVKDHI